MFVKAIEEVSGAVRPMHIIRRRFSDNAILPDIATLFFVNERGYAITTKRVATILQASNAVEQQYRAYLDRKSKLSHDESYRFTLKRLENEMKLTKDSIVQIRFAFMGCASGTVRVECKPHPKYDLALLHFMTDEQFLYHKYVTFAESVPKQGQSVCRLGFPIP
ncbi:MAG: serine protease, partial [Clostridia bacterium]|nr:serine protease [Clostridia bacterium]